MDMHATQAQQQHIAAMENALDSMDADAVESALTSAFQTGLHPTMTAVLIRLCDAPWHVRHEDVVSALQQVGGAEAIPALERAALTRHAYLDYDDTAGLACKCTWALADIGTTESRLALKRLSAFQESPVAGYAQRRISRWSDERARKRG